ncbi:acyl carrier protein [Streptomyces sp. NPDC005423]|uniref:acyl carrier protein n=1 Tax=Streptomyces sp. NPDC005423 TaxID=3155343 RepID=UPI0033BC3409
MTSEQTAPAGDGGELLAELTAVLAGVLQVDPARIDPRQPFQILGLDSLLIIEFVSAVNARFATRIAAAALYDHATPAALARHVAAERAARPAGSQGQAGPGPEAGEAAVLKVVRTHLARILHCDPWEIDPGADFARLGIDSILAAEFVAGVNHAYGLDERPVTLYDHPDLASMAAHVAAHTTLAPHPGTAPAAPPFAAGPLPQAAAGTALSAGELDALLDAVRDNRVSIDQAVALLAARAA